MQDLVRAAFAFLLERGTVIFPLTGAVLIALSGARLTRRDWNCWVRPGRIALGRDSELPERIAIRARWITAREADGANPSRASASSPALP